MRTMIDTCYQVQAKSKDGNGWYRIESRSYDNERSAINRMTDAKFAIGVDSDVKYRVVRITTTEEQVWI